MNNLKRTEHYLLTNVNAIFNYWGISSAGRAPALHVGGQRFDPAILHHFE
jgi:hypothetical protein